MATNNQINNANFPLTPSIAYTGTWLGLTQFTLYNVSVFQNNTFTTNYVAATYDSGTEATLTTLNIGSVSQINGSFSPTMATLTSFTASSLITVITNFSPTMALLTTLTTASLAYVGGNYGLTAATLTTLSLPALVFVGGTFNPTCALATTVTLTLLSSVQGTFNPSFAALTTLSLPALTKLGSTLTITAAAMTTFSVNSGLLSVVGNWTMTGMALNQASVDGILVRLAALDGTAGTTAYSSKTINLSGGTSATPSATGLTAKATLVARSCTVTTN